MSDLAPLLVQIPLVGIFIWFVLERDKRNEQSLLQRDRDWREFLREQRAQSNEAVGRLAEEIKSIAQLVVQTNTLIQRRRDE